ncbi:MAG: DUF2061 domain-containing protein [Verrucomicrobiota bacterium]
MSSKAGESKIRTLLKTISWRFVATLITMTIVWIDTGSFGKGATIGLIDTFIKFFAYYFHERAWTKAQLGYQVKEKDGKQSS